MYVAVEFEEALGSKHCERYAHKVTKWANEASLTPESIVQGSSSSVLTQKALTRRWSELDESIAFILLTTSITRSALAKLRAWWPRRPQRIAYAEVWILRFDPEPPSHIYRVRLGTDDIPKSRLDGNCSWGW